jgi:hypothetical protein
MASETETVALHLVRALCDVTDGTSQQWRALEASVPLSKP